MPYFRKIQEVRDSAELLEEIHQEAIRDGKEAQFKKDLLRVDQLAENIVLPQVWNSPLEGPSDPEKLQRRSRTWKLALLFSIINSLLFCGLVELGSLRSSIPTYSLFFCAVSVTIFIVIAFIGAARRKPIPQFLAGWTAVTALLSYPFYSSSFNYTYASNDYIFFFFFMPEISLIVTITVVISVSVLKSSLKRSFALLKKSLEFSVIFGFYLLLEGIFNQIIFPLIDNLVKAQSNSIGGFILVGFVGLIPVLALATVYDPCVELEDQDWQRGVSKLISNLVVVLLPLALAGLAFAMIHISFNLRQAYGDRRFLAAMIILLLSILGLLIAATPLRAEDVSLPRQSWLRFAILGVASMSLIVNLFVISAAISRIIRGLSVPRIILIVGSVVITSILALIIYGILRGGKTRWIEGIQRAFHIGVLIFIAWNIIFLASGRLLFTK